jgi:two-component system chemotaxis response regulator CheB
MATKSESSLQTQEDQHPPTSRRAYDLVVVAASAGGLNALSRLMSSLPADFPVPIVVVQHLDPQYKSQMAEILGRRTELEVHQVEAGRKVEPGTVYIAPPDHHVLIDADGTLRLSQSAEVHFVRPSADRLFASSAESYGERVIAVVLTGAGRDAAEGIAAIKNHGGTTVVQSHAEYASMPDAAIATHKVDHVLPLAEIPAALMTLVREGELTNDESNEQ